MKVLSNIRVIDVTEGVAGPFAATMLGDMGADVIKVERPEGDWGRSSGKAENNDEQLNAQFIALNRNKRDLGLNLRTEEGKAVFSRLLTDADVIISNYRPGVMARFGFSYERCQEINPTITYCTISAFGQKGAYARFPGSDTVLQSISGMMDMIGEKDGSPLRVAFPLIDQIAASYAVQAILLSLYEKKEKQKGANIDISLLNAALAMMSTSFSEYSLYKRLPERHGNQNPSIAPAGSFLTADGKFITVAVLRETHWRKFCSAIGHPELEADERFFNNTKRLENRKELNELLTAVFLTKPSSDWLTELQLYDILCAPLNNFADLTKDRDLQATVSYANIHLSNKSGKIIGNPIEYDGTFFSMEILPPKKGQHTTEILLELGFSQQQINGWFKDGVIFGK